MRSFIFQILNVEKNTYFAQPLPVGATAVGKPCHSEHIWKVFRLCDSLDGSLVGWRLDIAYRSSRSQMFCLKKYLINIYFLNGSSKINLVHV